MCIHIMQVLWYTLTSMAIDAQASQKIVDIHISLFATSSNVAPTLLMSTLILPNHLFLSLPGCLLPSGLPCTISCRSVLSSSYVYVAFHLGLLVPICAVIVQTIMQIIVLLHQTENQYFYCIVRTIIPKTAVSWSFLQVQLAADIKAFKLLLKHSVYFFGNDFPWILERNLFMPSYIIQKYIL